MAGLWAGDEQANDANTPLTSEFVTAFVKGGANGFALKGGDATRGALSTMFDGPRPRGYQPMRKQGAIILGSSRVHHGDSMAARPPPLHPHSRLGIGGDNSNRAIGTFFEGAITAGLSTDAADNAVQADIVAAGYGQ